MWLACALIILFSVGFVLPCMLDITMTPDSEFTVLSRGTWLLVTGAFWVFGAVAWLLVGRPRRSSLRHRRMYARRRRSQVGPLGAAEALRRHPAAQGSVGYSEPFGSLAELTAPRPLGPDDDEDFLLELARRIRESREGQ